MSLQQRQSSSRCRGRHFQVPDQTSPTCRGPRREPHERAQVKHMGKRDADDILADDEDGREHGHLGDERTAFLDEADAGRIADTREKQHHADVLHDGILFVRPDAIDIEDVVDDCEQDTSDHWSWNTVFAQEWNLDAQQDTDIIYSNGCSQCLVDVKIYIHSETSFAFSRFSYVIL